MNIKEELFALQDISYADFQARLIPNIPREMFIVVRVTQARKLAKMLAQQAQYSQCLSDLPHKYYVEHILTALLLSDIRVHAS